MARHPPGSVRIFTKSGNKVQVLERIKAGPYKGLYVVKRVDTGKEMLATYDGLA